jgi:pantetheine-phosphate adenylyltransferase
VKLALYPGTFDPITKGHMDVITRAIRIFDRLVVAVAENPAKKPLFNLEERIDLTRRVVEGMEDCDRVEVVGFENLTVEFARSIGATAIIRGLRAVSDFEYELQIALTNRKLALDIESVFLMPSVEYIYLNSTIVKQVAKHGGDVRNFVPEIVMEKLEKKFKNLRITHDTH